MSYFALVMEQSRKARAVRHVYEYLRSKIKNSRLLEQEIELSDVLGRDGIIIDASDMYRVLNVRLHDEHLSPYFQTNMNLFQMLMIDENSEVRLYRAEKGWLFVFEDLPPAPSPFGQSGFDMR